MIMITFVITQICTLVPQGTSPINMDTYSREMKGEVARRITPHKQLSFRPYSLEAQFQFLKRTHLPL